PPAALQLAISILRMKAATFGAVPESGTSTDTQRVYEIVRPLEISQSAEQLAAAILPPLKHLLNYDLAALLLEEGPCSVLSIQARAGMRADLEECLIRRVIAEHVNQRETGRRASDA